MKIREKPIDTKVCDACGRTLPLTHFRKWKNQYAEGVLSTCEECRRRKKECLPIVTVEDVADAIARRKTAIEHATVYVQFLVHSLMTEAIIENIRKIRQHSFFRQRAKQLVIAIYSDYKRYDNAMINFYSDDTIEKLDDMQQHFLQDVKDQRTQVFYAIANHYAKINHKERNLITMVEYLYYTAELVMVYRNNFIQKFNKYSIPFNKLNAFELDRALLKCRELANLCRRQYSYEQCEAQCPHLTTALTNLCNKIDYIYKKQVEGTCAYYNIKQ